MDTYRIFHRLLRLPTGTLHTFLHQPYPSSPALRALHTSRTLLQIESHSHVPRIAEKTFWQSLIPKPLRKDPSTASERGPGRIALTRAWLQKPWNPATVFIIFSLMIGSNAINTIVLKHEMAAFTRKTDAHISLLREVIERVQAGEEVDVEKLLGTGDERRERDWEEVLREIEEEDELWQSNRQRRARNKWKSVPIETSNIHTIEGKETVEEEKPIEAGETRDREGGQVPMAPSAEGGTSKIVPEKIGFY